MQAVERHLIPSSSKAESILAAAKRTFLATGFGAVSMDTIAREASVSKATVYAHFAGKEELFGAVIERECERYFAGFSAGELDPLDVRASLTVLGRRFLELLLSPDGIALHRIILGEVTRFPGLGEVFWRAGPERQRLPDRGLPARARPHRAPWHLPIPGLPPSNSSPWCAAKSSCAICCASKPTPISAGSAPPWKEPSPPSCEPSSAAALPTT